jgi:hypothetical protein
LSRDSPRAKISLCQQQTKLKLPAYYTKKLFHLICEKLRKQLLVLTATITTIEKVFPLIEMKKKTNSQIDSKEDFYTLKIAFLAKKKTKKPLSYVIVFF